jgi:ribose 5-phosphate isomerase A
MRGLIVWLPSPGHSGGKTRKSRLNRLCVGVIFARKTDALVDFGCFVMDESLKARDLEKKLAARRAAEMVKDGQLVGLGTGSTAIIAIMEIGKRVLAEGLKIRAVATSAASHMLGVQMDIPMIDLNDAGRLDITIDGADEINPRFSMIKGGGGALVREKLVAFSSDAEIIVVDSSKRVSTLGEARPLPVEVLKFAWRYAARRLQDLGCTPHLRQAQSQPFESDNGNYILDCDFGRIDDPADLETTIKLIPGVVESGLFIRLASTLIVGIGEAVQVIDCKN